mmetsp:Transcript_28798/g.92728  ORF Transcript_28798/g.92728 Transcript_28798/m.92728 type:complete len:387 (+) Transcript_28798:265-1425(+)
MGDDVRRVVFAVFLSCMTSVIQRARAFEVVGLSRRSHMPASRQEVRRVSSVLAVKPMILVVGKSSVMSFEAPMPSRTGTWTSMKTTSKGFGLSVSPRASSTRATACWPVSAVTTVACGSMRLIRFDRTTRFAFMSSTTRARPTATDGLAAGGLGVVSSWPAGASSWMRIVVPRASEHSRTKIRPPRSPTSIEQIARPRPVPTMASEARACWKSSKMASQSFRGMPTPVSIFPERESSSATTFRGDDGGTSPTVNEIPLAFATDACIRATSSRSLPTEKKLDLRRRGFPAERDEKSKTSSTAVWTCRVAEFNMSHASRRWPGASAMCADSISVDPQTAFRGVRISWEIFPTKEILERRSEFSKEMSACDPTNARIRSLRALRRVGAP